MVVVVLADWDNGGEGRGAGGGGGLPLFRLAYVRSEVHHLSNIDIWICDEIL